MNREPVSQNGTVKQTTTIMDYVKEGVLYVNSESKSIMVETESDLAILTDYPPGTMAFTAGYAAMWQLSAAGEWVSMV